MRGQGCDRDRHERPARYDGIRHGAPGGTRALLHAVVDGHYDGSWAWEPASGTLWCSDTLLAAIGESPESFTPHYDTFREMLAAEDRERVEDELRSHVIAGRDYRIEFRMRHRSGALREIESRGVREQAADGRHWFVGIIRDVTEERATRRALEESEARFRQLAENIPGAVFQYVLLEDGRDAIDYISRRCEEIWEVPAEDVRRDPGLVWGCVLPEDVGPVRDSVARSAQALAPWDQSFRIRTPSGRHKWLHGRGSPTRRADGATVWDSIVIDVTELRTTEADLRESQARLARAKTLEALGKLTGGVAHDFNNLLAVIVGNAELLRGRRDPAELAAGLEQILDAAERGSALTRSLLNFARQAPLAPTTEDLAAVVEDVRALSRRTVPESIRIRTELPPAPCHAAVDRNTLENALLNLVLNARDAMPDGGDLLLRLRTIDGPDPSWQDPNLPPGSYHEIAVIDTGRGIAPDVLERVFDPFFSTKTMAEGSGLGLSMVQGFTSQSGGTVRIASTPGAGTEVAMLFPQQAPGDAAAEPGRSDAAAPRLPPLRTLVVEDDPSVRRLLTIMLEREGLELVGAASGDAAIDALDGDGRIGLVITDMVLPGRAQGADVVRHLRDTRPELPVLVLSGYAEEAAELERSREVDAVLYKPAPRELLIETLDRIVRTPRSPR
mgnify:CR=1 FL=1